MILINSFYPMFVRAKTKIRNTIERRVFKIDRDVVLDYKENTDFYSDLERYLLKDRRKVTVRIPNKKVPDRFAGIWWFLSHAENWEKIKSQIDSIETAMRSTEGGMFSKLYQNGPEVLFEWLEKLTSPLFRCEELNGYRVGIFSDGHIVTLTLTPE